MKKTDSPLLKSHDRKTTCRKTLLGYSVVFAIIAVFVYGVFFIANGRSLVLAPDGLSQHVTVLAYYGQYLRTILRNIFVEHTFVIPMFDFSIGLGGDIVSTLHYYGIGDPLNLFSVFVPEAYTEYLYGFLAVLRMYLSGISFAVYMLHKKPHSSAIVTGAIAYAFSGFSLRAATIHPFFMTGMLYIPLIFLGIDLILEKKSPILYISSVALVLVTNFYFAYMSCIIMLIYAAMSYFSLNKKSGAKVFFKTVGSFACYSFIGFLMSLIIFLPQIENVLLTNRLNTDNAVTLFYSPSYYTSLIDSITNAQVGSHWVAIGYTGVTLLCIIMSFVRGKKYKNIVIGFSASLIALLFPVFGHILNGFAYVTNRWTWIIAFIGAVAVVYGYNDLFDLNLKEKKAMWIICVAYLGLLFCVAESRSELTLITVAIMFAVLCLVTVYDSVGIKKAHAQIIVSLFLVAGILIQCIYRYDFREGNNTSDYVQAGDVYDAMYADTVSALINGLDDDKFFRYDDYNNAINENASLVGNTNCTSFYYSVANSYVSEFIRELGLNTPMEQRWINLDNRYILQSALGVKYVTNSVPLSKTLLFAPMDESLKFYNQMSVDSSKSISWYRGYASHSSGRSSNYKIFRNRYVMPMGYTYDTVMSREEYEQLSAAEKQNVILQTAVTDGTDMFPSAQIRTDDIKQYDIFDLLRSRAEEIEGISIEGNTITVTDESATLEFTVPVSEYSECYISYEGVSFEGLSPYDILLTDIEDTLHEQQEAIDNDYAEGVILKSDTADLDEIAETKLNYWMHLWRNTASSAKINAYSTYLNNAGTMNYYTPYNSFYSGADTFMVNLGCTMFDDFEEEITDTIKISFNSVGVYTIENWSVCYQSVENVINDYINRTENVLENVEITDSENTVKGTVSLDKPEILVMQIPYSDGWKAYVDGEEVEILNVNTMFCGIVLDAGEHTVVFSYATPHYLIAAAGTCVGIACLIVILIVWKRKSKKDIKSETVEISDL